MGWSGAVRASASYSGTCQVICSPAIRSMNARRSWFRRNGLSNRL